MTNLSDLVRGIPGKDGNQIEVQKGLTHIQYRYMGLEPEDDWKNIIAISELIGANGDIGEKGDTGEAGTNGDSPEIRVYNDQIQWKLSQAVTWIPLIDIADLKGESVGFTICFKRAATTPTKPLATLVDVAQGWSRTVEIANIDRQETVDGISDAIVGNAAAIALFVTAEAIAGRPLADVNNSGGVNTTDAFMYNQQTSGAAYYAYIEDSMHPFMVTNKVDYADYFDDSLALWGCVGKLEDDTWTWNEPILMQALDVGSGSVTYASEIIASANVVRDARVFKVSFYNSASSANLTLLLSDWVLGDWFVIRQLGAGQATIVPENANVIIPDWDKTAGIGFDIYIECYKIDGNDKYFHISGSVE